ncbi:hypothetical protein KY495_13600 [Massilia sp. PAMC28688]|uniref:hypothetical protein n=1 Tax=Massilia sp. PAMC28688 TaxID=2861283 RepID=UPI001C6266A9|nr:hypothetical protein [Massilia sp. PAMC28688]QYF91827.1 hypothetical protein KY495_13600 [Massilia sp. PAMC28688]
MNPVLFKALAANEVRLRLRRTSTLVALLAVAIISWLMMADPSTGSAVLVVAEARVHYTSSVIAIGAASLACIMFGLGGFYLVRGRIAEDVRSGTGSVIGATPVGTVTFLLSRWAGGLAYLGLLLMVFMLTMMALHLVRGVGPIEVIIYLQTFLLLLLPMLIFAVSFAVLFDSYAPLMGKAGDVLYFFIWCAQLAVAISLTNVIDGSVPPAAMFDFSGIGTCLLLVRQSFTTTNVALGGAPFDAALAPVYMKAVVWSGQLVGYRAVAATLALLPLLPSFLVFHRFSPDRIKVSAASVRRSPLQVLDQWARPLARAVQPLFRLAATTPGMAGQVMADVALTLAGSPAAIAAMGASIIATMLLPLPSVGGALTAAVAFWGILISDLSTRDGAADIAGMTAATPGGAVRRYMRQFLATLVLGLLFTGGAALRFAMESPVRAFAVIAGVVCLSALASMFGRLAGTARLFLCLFLFGLFVAVNSTGEAVLDMVGFNGVATAASASMYALVGMAAVGCGYLWNRRG